MRGHVFVSRNRRGGKFAEEDWPEEKRERFREMYELNVPVYKIGRDLGCTDTSVRKWAERLGLPLRSKNQHLARPAGRPMSNEPVRNTGCQWIEGDPRDSGMCGAKRVDGKPYCRVHCERAYVTLKPRVGFTLGPNYGIK